MQVFSSGINDFTYLTDTIIRVWICFQFSGRLVDKVVDVLSTKHGAWNANERQQQGKQQQQQQLQLQQQQQQQHHREFWKLDVWEDDARRRRRLIRNPLGSAHPEATLKACLEHGAPDDAIQVAQAEFHAHLAANRSQQAAASHDLVEDSELLVEDRELDSDTQGEIHFKII